MNDSELALAALLCELASASGYSLASVARARGMERWAGLSATSVYQGLRRLESKGLTTSVPDTSKTGRGPVGRLSSLTAAGAESVRAELTAALADAPEQSARYRIALSSAGLLDADVAADRLTTRAARISDRIREVAVAQGRDVQAPDSLGAQLIFTYVQGALEYELVATQRLRDMLREGRPR